jgi:phosphoribosylanthranilate isomerase
MSLSQPFVKVCGITSEISLAAAIAGGADVIGVIRVPGTPRYMPLEVAQQVVVAAKAQGKLTVAVFQNQDLGLVKTELAQLDVDFVQLHGQESVEYAQQFEIPVIKTFTLSPTTAETEKNIAPYINSIAYVLLDRPVQGQGQLIDLNQVAELAQHFPVIVAGGLTPDNIGEVVTKVGTAVKGFDVSGGVEATVGQKDQLKVTQFVNQVRQVSSARSI